MIVFYLSFIITFLSKIRANEINNNVISLNIINANRGENIPSTMHGVIFETNINRGDDGGLYGELIYNRAFQEKDGSLDGWLSFGDGRMTLNNKQPVGVLTCQLRYSLLNNSTRPSGFRNSGFYGMNIQAQNYSVSFYYRSCPGAYIPGNRLYVGISDSMSETKYGLSIVNMSDALPNVWTFLYFNISVSNPAPNANNLLYVEFPIGSRGDFEFNLISCFPPTYNNRKNGARIDIAQAFADLKPGYVRLPGGNDLEGLSIPERFIWNNTIDLLTDRPGRRGTWTGYNTEGFGILDLLNFVEDIGAIPILAVYAGYSLNGQAVPIDQLQPYIHEVSRELDFLLASSTDNEMGALRKRLGRELPFDIKYVEIGNEDGLGPAMHSYSYRWSAFYNALSQRYPNITFIATTTNSIQSPPAVDDHDYQVPLYFINNFRRYEKVPRPRPKVLIGEFSVINDDDSKMNDPFSEGRLNYPSIKSAVAESIYRIGFERNSDIVIGGCYAPVLQNINDTQWTPNLILFNAKSVVRSTSYLAQKMFGKNLGNLLLSSTAINSTMAHQHVRKGEEGDGKLGNLYFVATKRTYDSKLIVKLASVDANDIIVKAQVYGSTTSSIGTAYVLTAGQGIDPSTIHNTMENPDAASIKTISVPSKNGTWSITIPSWSVVVVTLSL